MTLFKKWHNLIFGIVLFIVTIVAYIPALGGGFIWDDDDHVTKNKKLRDVEGLKEIWFSPKTSSHQYYPIVFTSFWAEYQVWHLRPLGYHLVNVLLHAFGAILLWLILYRLSVPGAWLAAFIFALHPAHVESVAWISERKNVLSGIFYLSSLLAYLAYLGFSNINSLRADNKKQISNMSRQWGLYALAMILFICALLSKTVTASLPVVALLLIWWKRDHVGWRDSLPLFPFLLIGASFGIFTAWLEVNYMGTKGEEYYLSFVDRFLVAGRALWFYAGKLVWPSNLTFIYPRWEISLEVWQQLLFPLGIVIVFAALWLLIKHFGKAPLVSVMIFAVTLFPALGFVDVFPFKYSFVADHFQYLASISLIAFFSACLYKNFRFHNFELRGGWHNDKLQLAGVFIVALILCILGTLTWRQGYIYRDLETLWKDTIKKNPSAWMAHHNLGMALAKQGNLDEAIHRYSEALRIKANYLSNNNLGLAFFEQGRIRKAIDHYSEALRIKPDYFEAHNNLGVALVAQGKIRDAIDHYSEALRIRPNYFDAHYNFGLALFEQGNVMAAISHYNEALRIKPDFPEGHNNLGTAYYKMGQLDKAIKEFQMAIQYDPQFSNAHYNLGIAYGDKGEKEKAYQEMRKGMSLSN